MISNIKLRSKVSECYVLETRAKLSSPVSPQIRNAILDSMIALFADVGTLFECAGGLPAKSP
jgi:hypothetical protein